MKYGIVVEVLDNKAQVLFEDLEIMKPVMVAKHIEGLKNGDTVAVIFEYDMSAGIIIGVVRDETKDI